MKILFTASLKRKVTPDETSSRSNIIHQLASGLIKRGHTVSLLGTADSNIPGATILPVIERGWVDLPPAENQFFQETASLVKLNRLVLQHQYGFDIVHNHTYPDFFVPQLENELTIPLVTTVHIQATDYIDDTLSQFEKTHFISISKAHRKMFRKTTIHSIVHNGIDTDLYAFEAKKEDYLLWLGRLSKAKNEDGSFMDPKGVRWAIKLARETNSRLLLSGNVEDMEFFNTEVKPYLNDKIQWIGPVSHELSLSKTEVVKLMQKARAFLMTINWYEPFGLVMAEAGSCGTPVIAFDQGAVPEIIADGQTGFIIPSEQGIDGLKQALSKIDSIKPETCRQHIKTHFSVDKMVDAYSEVYKKIQSR